MSRRAKQSLLPGSYVSGGSLLHGVDARAKVIALLSLTVAVFVAKGWMLVLLAAVLALALYLSGMTPESVARGIRPTIVVLVFSLLANSFVVDGTADLVIVGSFGIVWAGVLRGIAAVVRIVEVVGFVLAVSGTTTGPELAEAITTLLTPLSHVGVSVDTVAMVITMALRFMPLTGEEFGRVREAQQARGVRFGEGSIVRRIRTWVAVLVPMTVSLFRRGDEMALAMRDRCYGYAERVREPVPLGRYGWGLLLGGVALAVLACAL